VRAAQERLKEIVPFGVASRKRKLMSAIGGSLRRNAYDRQYRAEHPLTDEQRQQAAKRSAEYRHRKKVELELIKDEVEAEHGRADRAVKRLSAVMSAPAEASSDDEESESEELSDEEDDFDEMPSNDDEEEFGDWTPDRVDTVYRRCMVNDRYARTEVGVKVAMFNKLFELVREQLKRTRYDGLERVHESPRQQRLSDELQFFVFMRWLRQVEHDQLFHFRWSVQ
jgi:hypothetical protein